MADVLAGKFIGRFYRHDRLPLAKAHLASGQVCALAAGFGEVDIAYNFFAFHKFCLTGSGAGRPDGCAA